MIYPRLELLRELLTEDGVVFVQIDDVEQPYLRVLMDEVFGRNNFINTISINMKNVAGASGGGEDKKLKKNIEYIHLYAKNYLAFSSFKGVYDYIPISELVQTYIEEGKSWKYTTALVYEGYKEYIGSTVDGDGNEIKIYSRKNPIIKSINQIMKDEGLSETAAYQTYAKKIFQTAMPQSSIRPRVMKKAIELGSKEDLHSIEYIPKTGKNKGQLYEQFYKGNKFRLFAWLHDVSEEKDGQLCKKEAQGTYWNFASETKNLTKEGSISLPNGKKPEKLIHRILTLATNENDLILDSFLGSGTTAAVAHKMNRRWIGIEMGEHAKTHCAVRLQKVIDGEQGGISKEVQWQGGGSFRFYRLGETIFDEDGRINKNIRFEHLAAHIWFSETKTPLNPKDKSPFLGVYNDIAYYLLYNGILGDKSISGGNVLTTKVLASLLKFNGIKVIYGETSRLGWLRLEENQIIFKQTPYDIKAR